MSLKSLYIYSLDEETPNPAPRVRWRRIKTLEREKKASQTHIIK